MILTRAELLSYTGSLKTITQLARAELTDDLAEIVSSTTDADAIHAALDTLTPALIQKYGQAAGSASTQLWNYIYEHDTGAYGNAVVYMNTYTEYAKAMAIDSNYAFSDGDDTDTDKATSFVADTMIHNILGSARSTMTQNSVYAAAHGTTTKYARVPQGAYTCAFCLMLASRGFVYASEESAGEFDTFHRCCDCAIVPSFSDDSAVEGYNPDELYAMYHSARENASSTSMTDILHEMRAQYGMK